MWIRSEIRNEEELNQILSNSELDDAGKAEAIKAMVGKAFVPTSKYNTEKANTKAQLDAYNTLKSEFETFKQSKMSDDEKKAEQEKIKEEAYQKANLTISRMYAENTFAKAGFKEEEYKGILDGIVQEDLEKTKSLAETICGTMVKQKQEVEKSFADKIAKETPKPDSGDGGSSETEVEKYEKLLQEATKKNDYVKMAYYTRVIQENKNSK